MKKWVGWAAVLLFLMPAFISSSVVAGEQEIVVGRIFYIDGNLFRYGSQNNELNAVFEDEPFSAEDTLFSEADGRAELIIPNGTWIRIGTSTQIRFSDLRADLVEAELLSGMARFYNKSPETVIRVISPFGNVTAHFGSVFDVYVGENAVEVLTVKGNVRFSQIATGAEYTVESASPSVVADDRQVWAGEGSVRPDWDQWNKMRDHFWAEKAREKGPSTDYLPAYLHDEAYALDENGRWENVFYEGSMSYFWRPSIVGSAWSPYSRGRWIFWYGDQTWVPAEPFGYLTHHYGNWIYLSNRWYWSPPPNPARACFSWYPGRVFWLHSKTHIGWAPLAPRETYYSRRHWGGPHTRVVTNRDVSKIHIDERNFTYSKHAVFVKRDNFKRVNNYENVREKNVRRSEHYYAWPVAGNPMTRRDVPTESGRHASNERFRSIASARASNASIQQYKAPHGEEKNNKSSGVQKDRKRISKVTDIRELQKKEAGRLRRDKPQDEKHTAKPKINYQEKKRGPFFEQGVKLSSPSRPEKPKRPSTSESLRNRNPEIKARGGMKLKTDDLRNPALRKAPQQSGRMEKGSRLSNSKEPDHNQIEKATSGEKLSPRSKSKSDNSFREKQRNYTPKGLEEAIQNRMTDGMQQMKKQSLPRRSWGRDRR